ncbi:MAG: xanthine dehydrogenase family protein molybdopterin-binding subunit [Azospirillaceae bacterium]
MPDDGIGARTLRKEDKRFLTGRGRYTADINRPGQIYAAFVRSPHAHAAIRSLDTAAASAMPGVVAVLTGEDLKADGVNGVPCGFSPTGGNQKAPTRPALAQGRVRFVGDLVAMVVAETLDEARDAAEAVAVDYDPLPAVVDPVKALADGAPLLHDDVPGNLTVDWNLGDADATDAAFAKAAKVVAFDLVNNRKIPNAMEPRASVAEYEPATDSLTLYTTSQNPHITRLLIAAFEMGIPEGRLRVVAPDVGGGFGSKIPHYPEELLVTWASRRVERPVKWIAERAESFMSDAHGRDHVTHAELALDADGKFLGLRVRTIANLGAYLSTFGALSTTYLYATLLSGQYVIPAIHCNVRGALTNTCPIDAERGAGRPEATFLVERIVEIAAAETGIDRIDLRRRNFVPADAFPYQTPVALSYDSGDYEKVLAKALEVADVAGFETRKRESAARGKRRGLGFSNYIEACGLAPSNVAGAIGAGIALYETAEIRFAPTGAVSVYAGTKSQGQGHETTFAQIVASRLGLPIDQIDVIEGDTGTVQWGHGTYGSRSLAVGGSAIAKTCDKIIVKAKRVAAHLMESAVEDVEFKDGSFTVAGTDRKLSMGEVIMASYVSHNFPTDELEPGLDERCFYDPANFTYPAGCHVCEIEVDEDTGFVEVVKFTAVDDFGEVVNPMIVEGQVHGGVVHGIGQALYEGCQYDPETGQLLTGSYMDYTMPRADNLPSFTVGYTTTPCPHNPLGVKGCGEAGAIAAPAAVINALCDALGIRHIDMPATPMKVLNAMQQAAE